MGTEAPAGARTAIPSSVDISKRGIEMFIGPLEAAVMRAIWNGANTTRKVYNAVRTSYTPKYGRTGTDIAFTSITTTMANLTARGMFRRTVSRRGHLYAPAFADELEYVNASLMATIAALVEAFPREAGTAIVAVIKKGRDNG